MLYHKAEEQSEAAPRRKSQSDIFLGKEEGFAAKQKKKKRLSQKQEMKKHISSPHKSEEECFAAKQKRKATPPPEERTEVTQFLLKNMRRRKLCREAEGQYKTFPRTKKKLFLHQKNLNKKALRRSRKNNQNAFPGRNT